MMNKNLVATANIANTIKRNFPNYEYSWWSGGRNKMGEPAV